MIDYRYRSADGDDRPVVIFGNLLSASLAAYCLRHDSPFRVAAFTVDAQYMDSTVFDGLPLVQFESLEESYPPADCRLLIPMGYQRINGVRRSRFEEARRRGYAFASYVSSRASVWPDLQVGENVLIYEHAIVQPFARIGENCIVRSGAHISHHCEVASHAFIAAEAAMGGETRVGEQSVLGIGAVVRDRIRIADRSLVGAGAVVVRDTESGQVYVGNPARASGKSAAEATGG